MTEEFQEDGSVALDTTDRRTVLRRAAVGTGLGASAFVAPTIASGGLVPTLAAASTNPVPCETIVGAWTETCFPTLGAFEEVSGVLAADLSLDLSIDTGNLLIDPILNGALAAIPPIAITDTPYTIDVPTTGTYCGFDDITIDLETSIAVPDAICGLFDTVLTTLLGAAEIVPATIGELSLDAMSFDANLTLAIPGWGSAEFTFGGDLGDPPSCEELVAMLTITVPDCDVPGLGDPCVIEECDTDPCATCTDIPVAPANCVIDLPDAVTLSLDITFDTDLTFDPVGFIPPITLNGDITAGATGDATLGLPDIDLAYGGTISCA